MRRLFALIIALVLLVSGVGPAAAEGPDLIVVQPQDGATIRGSTVEVTFQIREFTIVPSTIPLAEAGKHPEANRPGEGHIHLMLDLQPVVVWERTDPYRFTNVPPGAHQLMIEMVNNDHSALAPPVVRRLQIQTTLAPSATGSAAGTGPLPRTGQAGDLLTALAVLLVVGVFLIALGVIWTLQGVGILGGSVMSGVTLWAIIGPLVAVGGAALLWRARR